MKIMGDNYNGYGFCPKCGALMRDGTCPSCGFRDWGPGGDSDGQRGYEGGGYNNGYGGGYNNGGYGQYDGGYGGPPKKKKSKGCIVAVIVAAVIIVLLIVLAVLAVRVFNRADGDIDDYYYGFDDPEGGYGDDYWDYYDDYSDSYVPSEDDSYYEDIVDCTRTDLDYQIVWKTLTLYPDNEENTGYFYANYPAIYSEDDDYEEQNLIIEELALAYMDDYAVSGGGSNCLGYVTYMAEDTLSVVFEYTIYDSEEELYEPRIDSVTFNMETGDVIEPEEMATIDEELVLRFRAQDSTQNGGVDFVQDATDEELLELLSDPDESVYFYSPVGLEVGINYDGGWVTVTLKDQSA